MFSAADEIIAGRQTGERAQPAHHRLLITVFGIYGRHGGGPIPVSIVLRLLQELGAEPASVRSSISRLKKKGVLTSERIAGQSAYALSRELEEHFRIGDEKIFVPRPPKSAEPWVLASFSVPETRRGDRNKIRGGLLKMGFGSVGPGLCIAPERLREDAARYINENGLGEFVEFFVSEHAGPGSLKQKVSQWWDLDALEHDYAKFVNGYTHALELWRGSDAPEDPREAFRTYIPMVTEWRRLPFLDPGLPGDLLPSGWQGENARVLFVELNALLAPLSARYARGAISPDR